MDGRRVVILHRVFDIELPVAREVVFLAARAHHVLEAIGCESLDCIAEMLHQRRALRIEVHEYEAAPAFEPDRDEAVVGLVESDDPLHSGRAHELSAERVRPGVIGTTDGGTAAAAGKEPRAAMPARVGKGVQLARTVADDDDGFAEQVGGDVVAGGGDLVFAADEIPGLPENAVDLFLVELLGCVAPRRHRLGLLERLSRFRVEAWFENRGRHRCAPSCLPTLPPITRDAEHRHPHTMLIN